MCGQAKLIGKVLATNIAASFALVCQVSALYDLIAGKKRTIGKDAGVWNIVYAFIKTAQLALFYKP